MRCTIDAFRMIIILIFHSDPFEYSVIVKSCHRYYERYDAIVAKYFISPRSTYSTANSITFLMLYEVFRANILPFGHPCLLWHALCIQVMNRSIFIRLQSVHQLLSCVLLYGDAKWRRASIGHENTAYAR